MHLFISIVLLIFGYYNVQAIVTGPALMGYECQMLENQMKDFETRNTFYSINEPLFEFSRACPEQRPYQHVTYYSFENTSPEICNNMNIVDSPLCGCKYPLAGTGYPPFAIYGGEPTSVPGCGKYLRQVTLQPPYL